MLIFYAGGKIGIDKLGIRQSILRNYIFSQVTAAIVTLTLYAPVLKTFYRNMGKVKIVDVDRLPFILDLLNVIFPAVVSVPGCILYSILFISGILFILKKDIQLFVYSLILFFVPITLYLLTNPMFVFKRYFISVLPFALLVVGCGIVNLASLLKLKDVYKNGFIIILLSVITYLQAPYIQNIVTHDRQNYREAVRFLESEITDTQNTYVFSIGHAGAHFRYYAETKVNRPDSFDEFTDVIKDKKYIWCLITAWLPDLRPPHEDIELYAEPAGHVKIYNFMQKHFTLKKEYLTKFPTRVYFLEQ
jgi:hypothetical protein